jgi:signal transduction histidine kinase
MESYQKEISQIQRVLHENPKGMTVTDISRKINVNRNSVAKYLDVMLISGMVNLVTFGPAKVFFPSKRIPITSMLNLTSDLIIVLDKDLKIVIINDSFLDKIQVKRENLIGQTITNTILVKLYQIPEINKRINEVMQGREGLKIIDLNRDKEGINLNIKIIPITFEDGKHGVSIICKSIIDNYSIIQELKKNEKNFRLFLK